MKKIISFCVLILFFVSCGSKSEKQSEQTAASDSLNDTTKKSKTVSVQAFYTDESEDPAKGDAIRKFKQTVFQLIKDKDFKKLSSMIHPKKGLRFSPYTYVNESDRVLDSAQLAGIMQNKKKLDW